MRRGGRPRVSKATVSTVSRPVFAVDLVSNSDRMLLAHRRNQLQATVLTHHLEEMDRKCRQRVYRLTQDIRSIYFEEQLPRQFEVLDIENRRKREAQFRASGVSLTGRLIPTIPGAKLEKELSTGGEGVGNGSDPEKDEKEQAEKNTQEDGKRGGPPRPLRITPLSNSREGPEISPSASGGGNIFIYNPEKDDSSLAGAEESTGASRDGRNTSTVGSAWRRTSIITDRKTPGWKRDTMAEQPVVRPPVSLDDIMSSVRAIHERAPRVSRPENALWWQDLLASHMTRHLPERPVSERAQQDAPNHSESFAALIDSYHTRGTIELEQFSSLSKICQASEVDFNKDKWRKYEILLNNATGRRRLPLAPRKSGGKQQYSKCPCPPTPEVSKATQEKHSVHFL